MKARRKKVSAKPTAPDHGAHNYTLPAAVTIDTIEGISEDFTHIQFEKNTAFILDAAQTETITTPGAQFILALSKALERIGTSLIIKNCKPNFTAVFNDLGLAAQLVQWGGV